MNPLVESHTRTYYTTARWINDSDGDWLWINPSTSHQFSELWEAENLAELANHNGVESGLDVLNFPYFAVQIVSTSKVSKA